MLPSRLIDIGHSGMNDHLRLCTTDIPLDAQYATLSHCWGQLDFVKLSRANLASFRQSIPYQELPKTFQETITITRQFGLRYLWIDSLCIIQDEIEDWSNEAPRMATVYGNSSLNIAATGARDGSEGLFFHRDPDFVRRCLVWADPRIGDVEDYEKDASCQSSSSSKATGWGGPKGHIKELHDKECEEGMKESFQAEETEELEQSHNQKSVIMDQSARDLFYCVDGDLYRRSFYLLPLVQRGWVLQERLLAPRTLHLGQTQMMWECQSKICFETFPSGMPEDVPVIRGITWVAGKNEGFLRSWASVVDQYSQCLLSNGSDKFAAISGLAKSFADRYGGHYSWGMWSEHLPSTLLWHSSSEKCTRPYPLRAPTWSWGSIDGPVGMREEISKSYSCIVVETKNLVDSFDQFDNWLITIKCERLLEVTSIQERQVSNHWYDLLCKVSVSGLQSNLWDVHFNLDEGSQKSADLVAKIYFLDIEEQFGSSRDGLILQAVDGKKGYFRRLGTYTAYDACEAFAQARSLPVSEDELSIYDSKCVTEGNENPMYIIHLT